MGKAWQCMSVRRLILHTVWIPCLATLVSGCESLMPLKVEEPQIVPPPPVIEQNPAAENVADPKLTPLAEKTVIAAPKIESPTIESPTHVGVQQLRVLGAVEWVLIDPPGVTLEARIDTGAETSSLHASKIQRFDRDGDRWVRFVLTYGVKNKPVVMERPVTRRVLIKRHESESQRRYVVKMWLSIGEIKEEVEVTLTDRSDFEYPLLVGRNFLTDTAIVDVSRHHTVK